VSRLVVCDAEAPRLDLAGRVDQVYSDLDELLGREELDLGIVSLRNDEAPAVAERLIQRRVPLVVEKPVARTAAEVARLEELAVRHQVRWASGFLNRYHPLAQEFRRVVAGGALGRIVSIEGRMVTSSVEQRDPVHWLFSRDLAGGGILHWLAIHTIDLVRFISGLEYQDVSARVATLSDTGIDVEDMAVVGFQMEGGALGSLHAGYVLRQRYGDIGLTMRGTLGEAVWQQWDFNGPCHVLRLHSQAPGWETARFREVTAPPQEAPGYGGAMGLQFVQDFVAAARHGGRFVTDGRDALKALSFVEAAYRSSAAGGLAMPVDSSSTCSG
jgi:predicted dehydrogenase